MIELFPHNQIAYDKVVDHFKDNDRACVVQPCGTGKSWIAFKLIEDNPTKNFLWMSPNKYIFEEQRINAKRLHGADFNNVDLMTYSYAGHNVDNISASVLNYDYVILDEFHHLAADKWGSGVKSVLCSSKHAKILGLTATPLRTDDVDTVELLFANDLVSHMDIAEAMSSGILRMPKYVIADYLLQSEIEQLSAKIISRSYAKDVEDKLNALFKILKNDVESANKVDAVMSKHLSKSAKVVVFCNSVRHLERLVSLASDWFGQLNDRIHTYKTYSKYFCGANEYDAFKSDASDALKVLYVVDQLNEGVHIHDLDAVIMCRSTKSQIIFSQQLGRAIEAGSAGQPLIIDLVDNLHEDKICKSLIDDIKDQMTNRKHLNLQIVEKYEFELYDYTVEPRHFIEQIKDLSDVQKLIDYTSDKIDRLIDEWIELNSTIRRSATYFKTSVWRLKKLQEIGKLSDSQISRLLDNGFVFQKKVRYMLSEKVDALIDYFNKADGRAHVIGDYNISDVACYIRKAYRRGDLSVDQIDKLRNAGFDPAIPGKHRNRHQVLNDAFDTLTRGDKLSDIDTSTLRRYHVNGKLSPDEIHALQDLGFVFTSRTVKTIDPRLKASLYERYVGELTFKELKVTSGDIERFVCDKCHEVFESTPRAKFQQLRNQGVVLCTECTRSHKASKAARPIRCVETGDVYDSIKSAALAMSKSVGTFTCVMRSERKSCAGYHWEYVDESESDNA